MTQHSEHPFYFFIHIPKTAGTTLRFIVDHHLEPKNVLTYYNQPSVQLLENLDAHLSFHPHFQALIGHFKFGLHAQIARPSTYITFLRHPVARTISQYKEWLEKSPKRLRNEAGGMLTLAESVARNPDYYADYQTRYLVGDAFEEMSGSVSSAAALANLAQYFSGVGLVEYFDQSISHISNKLGWPPLAYEKHNVKDIPVETTPELIAQIIALNPNDLIVYETVKAQLLAEFAKA